MKEKPVIHHVVWSSEQCCVSQRACCVSQRVSCVEQRACCVGQRICYGCNLKQNLSSIMLCGAVEMLRGAVSMLCGAVSMLCGAAGKLCGAVSMLCGAAGMLRGAAGSVVWIGYAVWSSRYSVEQRVETNRSLHCHMDEPI